MKNLWTDEMAFFHRLTKIGTDENKPIYSTWNSIALRSNDLGQNCFLSLSKL